MTFLKKWTAAAVVLVGGGGFVAAGQQTAPQAADSQQVGQQQSAPVEAAPPKGTVLFERHTDEAAPAEKPADQAPAAKAAGEPEELKGSALSDEERAALTITAWDLDARMTPAESGLEMHARVTVRNDGKQPLTRVALQVSSTLEWESAVLLREGEDATRVKLAVVQHGIETDADHTGKCDELVVELPKPLAVGESAVLDTLYGGTIAASGERLVRIGASDDQALAADWDAIGPVGVMLRGFGNVLWYPVAQPQVFLGDGNKLFEAVGASRLREEDAKVRLRMSLAFQGEAPVAVYFCGRRAKLATISDNSDAPVATGTGIATAEFAEERLGFRPLSLFTVDSAETLTAALTHADGKDSEDLLAVETSDEPAVPRLSESALGLAPLLQQWFGVHPVSALTVLDHAGQPFEDGPLLVAPMDAVSASDGETALLHSLTHAWVQTGEPWVDDGLAEFMALVYTEQKQGRDAAVSAMAELLRPVVIAEPEATTLHSGDVGQPLIAARDELYYRRKAAATWWALRSVVGEQTLQIALTTWLSQPSTGGTAREKALGFEEILEKASKKDLGWFFDDWVLHDRGLPDLTIAEVTPRLLPPGLGHETGWLVSVTVRNEGAAAAEVPLTVRAGELSVTRPIHVAGLSSATERVIIEAKPTEVLVNDGSMPELRTMVHRLGVTVQAQ